MKVPKPFLEGVPSYYIQASSVDRRLLKGEKLAGKKILNVGCGSHIFDDVYMAMQGGDVIGIDFSKQAVKDALNRLKIARKKKLIGDLKIKVETGDGRKLKYKDNTFDIVTSFSAIEHMPSAKDRLQAVKEMARVTKPNGIIIITGPNFLNIPTTILSNRVYRKINEFEHRYTPRELRRMFELSNLKVEKFDSESVYVIDKRLLETRMPFLKSVPMIFFKPLSFALWTFNALPFLKKFGMRMGYKARKTKTI